VSCFIPPVPSVAAYGMSRDVPWPSLGPEAVGEPMGSALHDRDTSLPRGMPWRDEAVLDRDAAPRAKASDDRRRAEPEAEQKRVGTTEAEPLKTGPKPRHEGSAVTGGSSQTAAVSVSKPMTSS